MKTIFFCNFRYNQPHGLIDKAKEFDKMFVSTLSRRCRKSN